MNFFSLPRWVIWILVSLGAILLCVVWQWKRAAKLLDETSQKLEEAVKKKAEAEARSKQLEEAAERDRQLRAKREAISAEVKNELDKINQDREAKKNANKARVSDARETVAKTGSAVESLKAWRAKKRSKSND